MSSMNKVIIIGRLGNDPEVRQFPNGGGVTNISVATSERWTDKNTGERRESTEWHRISLFNRLGEIAAQYLRKGSLVYVEGSLHTRKYQDQQGVERYSTEIRASEMRMLSSNNDNGGQGGYGGNGNYGGQGGYNGGYNNQYNGGNNGNFGNQNHQQGGYNRNSHNQFNAPSQSSQHDYGYPSAPHNNTNYPQGGMGASGNNTAQVHSFNTPNHTPNAQASAPSTPKSGTPPMPEQNAINPAAGIADDDIPF